MIRITMPEFVEELYAYFPNPVRAITVSREVGCFITDFTLSQNVMLYNETVDNIERFEVSVYEKNRRNTTEEVRGNYEII